MADDKDLAASPDGRKHSHYHRVRLAASITSWQWIATLRVHSRRADSFIRDQGRAIAASL
jgi:hypothetical protein